MQVTQTIILCLVDDYGIGIGDIYSVLYYGGGYQHVIVSGHIFDDLVLQLFRFHLSVSHTCLDAWHYPPDDILHLIDVLHAVVYEEHLPSPSGLLIDDIPDGILVEVYDLRLYRKPVWRRSVDNRKIPGPEQGKL